MILACSRSVHYCFPKKTNSLFALLIKDMVNLVASDRKDFNNAG